MDIEPFSTKSSSDLESAIFSVLALCEDLRLVILFGSLASGTAHADSDLDLALDAGHPLDAAEKMKMIGHLSVATGRPVDLIRKHLFDQSDFLPYRNRILAERRNAWLGK